MATTTEELEKRLSALERKVAFLEQRLAGRPVEETPAERGARMIREAKQSQAQLSAGWAKAMEEMGVRGEPIGAEKLRAMIAACGFKPEDNEFSRGIIEMREE
jgi:hypothetical protein